MKLLADEGVDAAVVSRLRADGYSVVYVAECDPDVTDDEVLGMATAERCQLVTTDKDFGELVFRLRRATHGVILLRLSGLSADAKAEIVANAVTQHGEEIAHAFTVISPGVVRIRHTIEPKP
jgi:predicted nuclease of predicted toxin-antitoxin system